MKVGDLVYVPYFEDYGILVSPVDVEGDPDLWRVMYPCGYHSDEYEEDMEVINDVR